MRLPCAHGDVSPGLYYLVERGAVNHAVLDDGECRRAPRLYGDDVAVVELAHVQLACRGACVGAVRVAVDVQGAHAAYTLAAVVVEDERLLALFDELLVENVEHLEEGGVVGYVLHLACVEVTLGLGAVLAPESQGE